MITDADIFHAENDSPVDLKIYIGELRAENVRLQIQKERDNEIIKGLARDMSRLKHACQGLIDYRDQYGALNFQLEKADHFIHQMRVALEGDGE